MRNFPSLRAAHAAVAAILTAGAFVIVAGIALAQGIPSLALSAKPEVDDSAVRGTEAVPAIAPIPSLLATAFPPKPSW